MGIMPKKAPVINTMGYTAHADDAAKTPHTLMESPLIFCASSFQALLYHPLPAEDGEGRDVALVKESASHFKSYASGRRFCNGVIINLDLNSRQDLFQGFGLKLLMPYLCEDKIDLEVFMKTHLPFV